MEAQRQGNVNIKFNVITPRNKSDSFHPKHFAKTQQNRIHKWSRTKVNQVTKLIIPGKLVASFPSSNQGNRTIKEAPFVLFHYCRPSLDVHFSISHPKNSPARGFNHIREQSRWSLTLLQLIDSMENCLTL